MRDCANRVEANSLTRKQKKALAHEKLMKQQEQAKQVKKYGKAALAEKCVIESQLVKEYRIDVSYLNANCPHLKFDNGNGKKENIIAHFYPSNGKLYLGAECKQQVQQLFSSISDVVNFLLTRFRPLSTFMRN